MNSFGPQHAARGGAARNTLLALFTLATSVAASPAGAECGEQLPAPTRQLASGDGYQVAFVASAWPVPLGQHFSLDLVVCGPPGAAAAETLRIDADMPAHRHGMNYRASVQDRGGGRFHAEGLMFHMAGRWRLIFDLHSGTQTVRLTHEVVVQ